MTCSCDNAMRLRKAIKAAIVDLTAHDVSSWAGLDILEEALDERNPKDKLVDNLLVALRLMAKDPPPKEKLARRRWDYVVRAFTELDTLVTAERVEAG